MKSKRNALIAATLLTTVAVATAGCGGDGSKNAKSSASAASSSATTSATAAPSADQHALAILDAVVRGDFASATADFDPTMKEKLTPDQLADGWRSYEEAFGKYQSHGAPADVPINDLTVVRVPLQMEKMPGEYRVTFHPDGTVAGLYFLKAGVPL